MRRPLSDRCRRYLQVGNEGVSPMPLQAKYGLRSFAGTYHFRFTEDSAAIIGRSN